MSTLSRELRHALRVIFRTPVVATIAILSLALGIAANISIFSLFHSFLLRPLPYVEADRLAVVWESERSESDDRQAVAPANYFDWREQSSSFEVLVASEFDSATLTGTERPQQLTISRVTPDFFGVLGSAPLHGRSFHPTEGRRGEPPVTVIGEALWRTTFGADEALIGETITLDDEAHHVVGIMPESFDYLLGNVDLWVAFDFGAARDERQQQSLIVTGKLNPGVTLAQAQAEMNNVMQRLETLYPETNAGAEAYVQAVRDVFPGATDTRLSQILMIVVVMVLMVACVNVASLLLAKSDGRQREIAMRVALGASRGRLLRQLLTESVLMALIAGALGTLLSIFGIRALAAGLPDLVPSFYAPRFDGTVLAFGLAVSLLAGLTFGLSPALQAIRGSLSTSLLDSSRGATASRERKRMLSGFVIAEFALALTILIGAAVMTDIFDEGLSLDPGFDPRNLLTMRLELPEHRFADEAALASFSDRLGETLDGLGAAAAATLVSELPRTRNLPFTDLAIDGRPTERDETLRTGWLAVRPGYFAAMDVRIEAGRAFRATDDADAAPVLVVNQTFADRHFPASGGDGGSIGRRITVDGLSREIVGVANDVAQERMSGLQAMPPVVYFPIAQHPARHLYAVLRVSAANPDVVREPAQRAIWALDPAQPISDVRTMAEHIELQLAGPVMISNVLFGVGALALLLAAIGIYGVMTFSVSQQTGEIGLRMALGAKPDQILSRITRQGAVLAGLGFLVGIPVSAAVVALIGTMVDAAASDGLEPVTGVPIQPMVEIGGVLALVGLLACYLPARRATRVDPVRALQSE